MKIIITALGLFLLLTCFSFGEEKVMWASEGEDATSTHYYFYYSNGESIEKVRWIWNGGAQNSPMITEFIIDSNIRVSKKQAERSSIPALIAGRDAPCETISEYSIICKNSDEMLLGSGTDSSLTKEERVDLYNLISLLAKDRKAFND